MHLHYSGNYHRGIATTGTTSAAKWLRHREIILRHKPVGNLLDLGCSNGSFLRTFANDGWKLYGVEFNPAQARVAGEMSGAQIYVGDILDAPFEPGTIDAVTCFHVLEHHADPTGVLRRVWGWLKEGGIFYVAVPNINSWEATLFKSYWYGLELPRHLYHFSPSSLSRLAETAGFNTVQLATFTDSYMEHSIRYIFENVASRLGFSYPPMSEGLPASFPLKVVRKVFRLTAETAFRYAARLSGAGASIEAILVKPRAGGSKTEHCPKR